MSNIDEKNDKTSTLLELFHQGLGFYYKQDWENAIKYFKKSDEHEEKYATRKTTPSQVFIKRSEEFKDNPPPKDWDGTYALGSK
jgi:TPR repeat protein